MNLLPQITFQRTKRFMNEKLFCKYNHFFDMLYRFAKKKWYFHQKKTLAA